MDAIFKIAGGVPCRACGAVLAHAHPNSYGLCDTCWTQVTLSCGTAFDKRKVDNQNDGITDENVTAWLASKLVKDLKRLERTGITGRCEAVSGWSYGHPGNQCGHVATQVREGFRVCSLHAKATKPFFIDHAPHDPYESIKELITRIASVDARFAEIIREVAS